MMLPRRRFDSLSSEVRRLPSSFLPESPSHPHVSVYRSLQMEVQIYSPSVKILRHDNQTLQRPLPVFGDHDQVVGRVFLDSSCYYSGHLVVSIEGAFLYDDGDKAPVPADPSSQSPEKRKHVFYSASTSIPVSPGSELSPPRSVFRETFRRPSVSSLNLYAAPSIVERSYPFTFEFPHSLRPGEDLPPTFPSLSGPPEKGLQAWKREECFEIAYNVTVSWEPCNQSENQPFVKIPILFQPDMDFQSLDGLKAQPDSWLEMPLRSDRPIPFRCAMTLPTHVSFSRASSIQYFVVFTTTPRSPTLAREVAADATISVSLLRQVTIIESTVLPPTPPHTPTSPNDELGPPRHKFLRRIKSSSPILAKGNRSPDDTSPLHSWDKPLPQLPPQVKFSESLILQTSMCIGFPKRPRNRCEPARHPSLDTHSSLPDGLFKGKIQLDKNMLPCIDWSGVNVKYYLDVSVLIGQDDLRARIPIRIL